MPAMPLLCDGPRIDPPQSEPMSRRVEDLALITPIISGPDYRDAACAPVPWADPAAVDIGKLRVAWIADNGSTGQNATHEDTKKTVHAAAAWLTGTAANVTEDAPKDALKLLTEARRNLSRGDGSAFYKRLADKWGTKNFSPGREETVSKPAPLTTAEMVQAWEQHDLAKSRMLAWMKQYDVFITPVNGRYAQPIDQDRSNASGGADAAGGGWPYTGAFNSTGWPVVVVRCGSSADGKLPIGLQVVAKPWREDVCIAVGSYLESKSGGWRKPPI